MIHLDTSFLIGALLKDTPEAKKIREWLVAREPVGISAICWAEFLCGPLEAPNLEPALEILGEPAPFTIENARVAARLFNESGRRRGSFVDCMVAASAMAASASLATSNPRDFLRLVPLGLRLAGRA